MPNNKLHIVYEPKNPNLYIKDIINTELINGEYTIVWSFKPRYRFLVSENTLKKYIGEKNANTAILRHLKNGMDKTTCKFRKFGKIDIYNK